MNLTRARERYLAALGLTALVGCHGAEPTSTPTAKAETGAAPTASVAPETTAASTAQTAAPTSTGGPATAQPGAWVPASGPIQRPRPGVPTCQHGNFCVAGAGDSCPATVTIPTGMGPVAAAGGRPPAVTHDPARTTTERATHPGACCYEWHQLCVGGRALRGEEGPITANAARRDDWALGAPLQAIAVPSPAVREALAAYWEREAAFEHASVAAFARASLALLAVGAPPDLLAATHAAALDEIEHARLAYGLASRYGGAPRGPGPLPVEGALSAPSLAALAVETFLDGCAGEAAAALALREGAAAARDEAVREVLLRIAEDEERHAELAFRTVAWALRADPEAVAPALAEAAAVLRDELSAERAATGRDEPDLAPYGALGDGARRAIRRRALAEVVLPCASALLS